MARSSSFHPTHFEMKSMDPKQLSETRTFLEQSFLTTHIRYPLHIEKSEEFLANEKILLIGNEGRTDPGFLCFLPRKPVQFLKCRLDSGHYLRLRVEPSLFQDGTVFIASSHLNTITVQDCWMWQGESLTKCPYSKRFSYVTKFLTSYIIQDPKLSGFEIQAPTHYPLDSFQHLVESQDYASIDFIPETSRRRRLFYRLETSRPTTRPVQTTVPRPKPISNTNHNTKPHIGPLIAFAKNIQGLPDTFDLFGSDKVHIGEAAIQEEETSIQLGKLIQKTSSLVVVVEWNSFLDAYEIKGIAPSGSRVLPSTVFKKVSLQMPSTVAESRGVSEHSVDFGE
jgi:hypothetical protein